MRSVFRSFFIGGFECSCHRLRSGKRLDMVGATAHDRHAFRDYRRLTEHGIRTARDGLRWHLIEQRPGSYDFSSVLPMVRAAREAGVQVIWDLCHYGWPDDIDLFRPAFVRRFARFARAFAELMAGELDEIPFYAPINEISFWSWAGGDVGYLNPFAHERGFELKAQLVRAAIEAIEAIWSVEPKARIVHTDPVIHIVADPSGPHHQDEAERTRLAQYQAWDMLEGRLWPLLGGAPRYLDIVGVNYYRNNQWIHGGPHLTDRRDPLYRPLRSMLQEVYERYRRPLFIAETGTELDERAPWLRHIGEETRAAMAAGVPLEGICLYPIVNHPGWDDDRHCQNGLWDYADEAGERKLYAPLAQELTRQQALMEEISSGAP